MKNFVNKYSFIFSVFTILEQMIVALSTFCMIKLGEEIVGGRSPIWFGVFVISLIIVFVPRIFKQKYIIKAEYKTFEKYIFAYEKNLYNYPFLKTNHEFCDKRQSFFHNQTWQVIEETYTVLGDFFTTILNVVFNVLIIGGVLNRNFFLAYLVSLCFVIVGAIYTKKKIAEKSSNAQVKQSEVQNALFTGWDTLLIGNDYNWSKWYDSFKRKIDNAQNAEIKLGIFNNCTSLAIMMGSIIPIVVVIAEMIFNYSNNVGVLAATLLTLPRQVNTIQYLSIIIEYLTELIGIKERINNINISSSNVEDIEKYCGEIEWANLEFEFKNQRRIFKNLQEFLECLEDKISKKEFGRLIIRGTNGSGKTTLLALIKQYYGNDAFLLPVQTRLFFENADQGEYSTGQRLRVDIEEIFKNNVQNNIKVFLLDEWNANLDLYNQKEITERIEQLAMKRLVLEARNKDIS